MLGLPARIGASNTQPCAYQANAADYCAATRTLLLLPIPSLPVPFPLPFLSYPFLTRDATVHVASTFLESGFDWSLSITYIISYSISCGLAKVFTGHGAVSAPGGDQAVRGARAAGATWQAWAFSSARALFQDGRARLALQRQNKNLDDLFNVLAREAMMRFLFALP